MNSTGYLTDQFSTLAGLAGVAYGDVEYFREVQNQIYNKSPLPTLNISRPSSNLEGFILSLERLAELIIKGIEQSYNTKEEVEDYFDTEFGPDWKSDITKIAKTVFNQELDSFEAYQVTYSDLFIKAFESIISNDFILEELLLSTQREIKEDPIGEDFDLVLKTIGVSPQNKISALPPNSIIDLDNSVQLGKDFKGVEFVNGYLTPFQYYSGLPYPSFTNIYEITNPLLESVRQGYIGYPSQRLENSINPVGAQPISFRDTSDLASLYELVEQTDRDIYDLSLIGARINGFLSYDAETKSNGDFIDRSFITDYNKLNQDPAKGAVSSVRETSKAF